MAHLVYWGNSYELVGKNLPLEDLDFVVITMSREDIEAALTEHLDTITPEDKEQLDQQLSFPVLQQLAYAVADGIFDYVDWNALVREVCEESGITLKGAK